MRANQLRQEFFTPETLAEICSRLVTHYFLLTPAELELWDTDPESFGKYLYTYIHTYIHIYIYIYMSEMKEHRNLPFGTLGRPLVLKFRFHHSRIKKLLCSQSSAEACRRVSSAQ